MGNGMGRQRSRSVGANMVPSPQADPHGPAFANTCPLALVDKHSRGKDPHICTMSSSNRPVRTATISTLYHQSDVVRYIGF